jgi:hypothetical protein
MKFQRLAACFRGRGTQRRYQEGSILKPEVINSRWRRQTGCTFISASRQDSEEIPTAICMFLGSQKSIMLSERLHLETGSQKFKMAPVKPAVPVSQLLYMIAKKFQRLTLCFQGRGIKWRY